MEACVLIGGLLFAFALGFFALDRLDRFVDRGGLSPYWDREEEEAAGRQREGSGRAEAQKEKNCCGSSDTKRV